MMRWGWRERGVASSNGSTDIKAVMRVDIDFWRLDEEW